MYALQPDKGSTPFRSTNKLSMESIIECPFCTSSAMTVHERPLDLRYKDVTYTVIQYLHICEQCGEEFTTDKLDKATLSQIPGYTYK